MSNYIYNANDILNSTVNINTTAGSNGTWTNLPYTVASGANWTNAPVSISSGSGKIECTGTDADLVLNGKSVRATLEAIEQRLAILQPAPELEREWDELKRLGDEYRALEADIRAKMQVWDKLKKDYE